MSDKDQSGGCLGCLFVALFISGGLILAVFFPETREGAIAKPVVEIWDALLGVPLPSYDIGDTVLRAIGLLVLAILFALTSILIAWALNTIFIGVNLDIQTVGAFASIIGLLVGVLTMLIQWISQ